MSQQFLTLIIVLLAFIVFYMAIDKIHIFKESKEILEDLIMAATNQAREKLKAKTSEEISKATGGLAIDWLKFPF